MLSGPDKIELKQVRKALKSCLRTARILILERELYRFFMPEIENFRQLDYQEEVRRPNFEEETDPELTF